MSNLKPTAARVRSLLVYDPEELHSPFSWQAWVRFRPWETAKDYSMVDDGGHLLVKIDGDWFKASELAWLFMKGIWPDAEIEHIDGELLNNSWQNLRKVAIPKAA